MHVLPSTPIVNMQYYRMIAHTHPGASFGDGFLQSKRGAHTTHIRACNDIMMALQLSRSRRAISIHRRIARLLDYYSSSDCTSFPTIVEENSFEIRPRGVCATLLHLPTLTHTYNTCYTVGYIQYS